MANVINYECKKCGAEIVVTETLETTLRPIYCCGAEFSAGYKYDVKMAGYVENTMYAEPF